MQSKKCGIFLTFLIITATSIKFSYADQIRFSRPYGVKLDKNNNLFVADTGNNAIKEIPYNSSTEKYGKPFLIK